MAQIWRNLLKAENVQAAQGPNPTACVHFAIYILYIYERANMTQKSKFVLKIKMAFFFVKIIFFFIKIAFFFKKNDH
jgi:hypothetical protein